jgi:hypothetical protein
MEPHSINENSSINEKQRKLYLKINSLISSAENFETLKLYEEYIFIFFNKDQGNCSKKPRIL